MGRKQRKYEKEIIAREAAEKKVAADKAKKATQERTKAEQKARNQQRAEENPVAYGIAGLIILGVIIWIVVSMCSSGDDTTKPNSKVSGTTSSQTGSSTALASQARSELLSGLGATSFIGSGIVWAEPITQITEKNGDLYVSLQVDRSTADGKALAKRATSSVNNFLSDDLKSEIDWIIITDGTGTVMDQMQPKAGLVPAR